mmetsp:Transcript_1835/g.2639  ORF Transcript_1835/g.2639 Transcript_1835/m.2639 type:complete len:289 (+) Transcript_1835:75-941(+)|eukprot:CAMPEP_0184870896 /NCGR_PEP_ID=MMETSP0580-20130426/39158_1 /TAXON_ID=1118495 /ORGANISM="Dactyliosolen fragilissimus" /LENGTH=288 /DNA_ID=CAMNT_0027373259 /DNA_START=46 /DNA_END=912 /DNA_ORIENTATION=+
MIITLYLLLIPFSNAFVPFIDGGKGIPKLYEGYFNEQIAKQASSALSRAIGAGKTKIEIQLPPVPNVEEVRFGTPLNQKFGKGVIVKDLKIKGGYTPGSEVSRQLIGYSNVYWAKKLAGAATSKRSNCVSILTSEPINFASIQSMGGLTRSGKVMSDKARKETRNNECIICVNPGGEETWDRLFSAHTAPGNPFVVLNNAYSTSYDLGNKRGYEEAYYLKRISKGWVYRSFPGNWEAYIEKPDGSCELLESYKTKPLLREVSTLVREESFKRYAINNDRWTQGFGGRL